MPILIRHDRADTPLELAAQTGAFRTKQTQQGLDLQRAGFGLDQFRTFDQSNMAHQQLADAEQQRAIDNNLRASMLADRVQSADENQALRMAQMTNQREIAGAHDTAAMSRAQYTQTRLDARQRAQIQAENDQIIQRAKEGRATQAEMIKYRTNKDTLDRDEHETLAGMRNSTQEDIGGLNREARQKADADELGLRQQIHSDNMQLAKQRIDILGQEIAARGGDRQRSAALQAARMKLVTATTIYAKAVAKQNAMIQAMNSGWRSVDPEIKAAKDAMDAAANEVDAAMTPQVQPAPAQAPITDQGPEVQVGQVISNGVTNGTVVGIGPDGRPLVEFFA